MLSRLQDKYREAGLIVVAVNIDPSYTLEEWQAFWRSKGAGDVLWAQDSGYAAATRYQLKALGTEVVVDKDGDLAFRSDGPASHAALATIVERLTKKT